MKNKWMVFVSIGFEAIGVVLASTFLGEWLDNYFNSKGLFTILLIFVGLGGWFGHILFLLKKMNSN